MTAATLDRSVRACAGSGVPATGAGLIRRWARRADVSHHRAFADSGDSGIFTTCGSSWEKNCGTAPSGSGSPSMTAQRKSLWKS